MSFINYLFEDLLQEGGRAIKGSVPLEQDVAVKLFKQLAHQIRYDTKLVGSAGKKPKDAQSGDIDVAVACDWEQCKELAKELGQVRELKGLGIVSTGVDYGGALRQVDLIPTSNLEFCNWAYWNDQADLAAGLKGSHRNELLFACAKHALDDGRYILNLSKGLEEKTKAGRKLVASTPEEVCKLLLGSKPPKNLQDAVDAFLHADYPRPKQRAEVVKTFFTGLKQKNLSLDHPALEAVSSVT